MRINPEDVVCHKTLKGAFMIIAMENGTISMVNHAGELIKSAVCDIYKVPISRVALSVTQLDKYLKLETKDPLADCFRANAITNLIKQLVERDI